MKTAMGGRWAAVAAALGLVACGGGTDADAPTGNPTRLSVQVVGRGAVTSAPAGVSCTTSCAADFSLHTTVALTATPSSGQVFSAWGGDCTGTNTTCSLALAASRSVTATFVAAPPPAGWSPATTLSDSTGGAGTPRVVIDAQGRGLAVWHQTTPTGHDVWASRYLPASGWSAPLLLDNSHGGVRDLQLVIHRASGHAMVAWHQITSTAGYDLWARSFDPATGWGGAALVETAPGSLGLSSIGVDAQGDAWAVWSQMQGRFSVWANHYSRTQGWGVPVLIETNDTVGSTDGDPQVAVAPNGDALAVWKRADGTSAHLWGNRFTAASGWGTARLLVRDSGSAQSIGGFGLAMDDAGNALLAWGQLDTVVGGSDTSVWAKRFSGGAWQLDQVALATPVRTASGFMSKPVLRRNAAGVSLVVWGREDGALVSNAAPPLAAFGQGEVLRAAGTHSLASLPQIGLDDQGTMRLAWLESGHGTTPGLWLAHGGLGSAWAAPALFADTTGADSAPALDVNESGHALMAWVRLFDTGGTRIVVRQFVAAR